MRCASATTGSSWRSSASSARRATSSTSLVYTALLDGLDWHYRAAATGSFLVAVTNNYLWNRLWTFRHRRGHFAYQGLRFFVVSLIVYALNLVILSVLVEARPGQDRVAGDRGRARHPGELHRQQALVLSETPLIRILRLAALPLILLSFASTAVAAPFPPTKAKQQLTEARATAIFLADDKVADWLDRYPVKGRITDATYESDPAKCTAGTQGGCWTVHVWWKKNDKVDAGEIAQGKVDDLTQRVTEAWTGPQVAWKMARGYEGAFGGKQINKVWVWLIFCVAFLVGLADFRRPLSVRNLDLLVLLSFSVSLWYFNHGDIFTSVPLAYPPLVYLLRALRLDRRSRAHDELSAGLRTVRAPRRRDLHARLQDDDEHHRVERDRRRVRGRDRRAAHRVRRRALRELSGGGRPQGLRSRGCGRRDSRPHPAQRPLRVGEPARRHVRPGRVRGVPTGLLDPGLVREVGRLTSGAPDLDHLRRPLHARARARRLTLRRPVPRGGARVRVGRVSVHAVRARCRTRTTRSSLSS